MDCSSEAYGSVHEPQDIYEVVEVIGQEQETDYVVEIEGMEEDLTDHIDVDTDGVTHVIKTEEPGYAQINESEGNGYAVVAQTDADGCTQVVQTEGRKRVWTKPATKLMLCLLEDILPDVGTSEELRNKSEMWKIIAAEMKKEGYSFSPIQVENKFRAVERQYKKTALSKQNGVLSTMETRSSTKQRETKLSTMEQKSASEDEWMHSDKMGSKPDKSFVTKVVADLGPKVEQTTEDDAPSSSKKQMKAARSRQVQKAFAKMAVERKKYHEAILSFLKKKEERARKREERDCKKLELLELLLKEKGVE